MSAAKVSITGTTPMARWQSVANTGQFREVTNKVNDAQDYLGPVLITAIFAITFFGVSALAQFGMNDANVAQILAYIGTGIVVVGGLIAWAVYSARSRAALELINGDRNDTQLNKLIEQQQRAWQQYNEARSSKELEDVGGS